MDVRRAAFEAVVIERQPLVIQAHQVQERGVEVVNGCLIDSCLRINRLGLDEALVCIG